MYSSYDSDRPRRSLSWLLFLLSGMTAIGLLAVPAFIVWPFRHQTPSGLVTAMAMRQHAPIGTLVAFLICLLFAAVLWHADNLRRKIFICSILLFAAFSAVMSRLNYFEWMFHPIDSPQFVAASASKLAAGEMILAVRFGSDARAYPISQMAYHHVLNDIVADVPIAVTY